MESCLPAKARRCKVCDGRAAGAHFGVDSCRACAAFLRSFFTSYCTVYSYADFDSFCENTMLLRNAAHIIPKCREISTEIRDVLVPILDRLKPTELEFLAAIALAVWSMGSDKTNAQITMIGENYQNEFCMNCTCCTDELKVDNYALRIGEILTLALCLEQTSNTLISVLRLFDIFNAYEDNSFASAIVAPVEDVVHFILNAILDVSAIAVNVILIVAVVRTTPSIMRKYSALILFTSLVDCTAAFMSLMATAIVESHEGSIVFVYLGPCSLIHDKFCYVALASHVQSIGESCVLLLVSFSYRLWSFRLASSNNGPASDSRAPLIILCLLATFPAVIATVTFSFSASPPPPSLLDVPQLSGRLFSFFNMSAPALFSSINILPRISIGYIIFVYLAATPALFVIRRRLYQKICSLGSITDSSRHREIFRALTLHMFMPVTFSVGFVFWLLDFFDICQFEALQRSIMPISSTFAIISPLIVIFHLPPYRKFFMGFFWPCAQKEIISQKTSVSVISNGGCKTSLVNSRLTRVA